jgi:serine/threonine protein kinase
MNAALPSSSAVPRPRARSGPDALADTALVRDPLPPGGVLGACRRLRVAPERVAPNPGVEPGTVLAGRYRVDRVIGRGGMGIVVKATHVDLQHPVAIKLLQPGLVHRGQVVQRFLREAQLASRLTSEHVARVIDLGTADSGAPFMALEYLEGEDLSQVPRGRLTVGGIVDLMLQACEALAEAHALGIVHRDIKLANLFVTRRSDGSPLLKVLDFGTSRSALSSPLTTVHTVLGTPSYMSPEQIRSSRTVDHRSDIWSLGIVLYRLLQGTPPFDGDTFRDVALDVMHAPLRRLAVPVPRGLDEVVHRCLEKDPARRFQNVAELARALAPHAQSQLQAAISMERTHRVLGRATFAWARGSWPMIAEAGSSEIAPRARERVVVPAPRKPGGVRWSIAVATLLAACAIGVVAAIATRPPDPLDGALGARTEAARRSA